MAHTSTLITAEAQGAAGRLIIEQVIKSRPPWWQGPTGDTPDTRDVTGWTREGTRRKTWSKGGSKRWEVNFPGRQSLTSRDFNMFYLGKTRIAHSQSISQRNVESACTETFFFSANVTAQKKSNVIY